LRVINSLPSFKSHLRHHLNRSPAVPPFRKRHTADCLKQRRKKDPNAAEYHDYSRCKRNYQAVGMLGDKFIRKSLKTSNFETAINTVRQWAGQGELNEPKAKAPIGVQEAVKTYLDDAKARNLGEATLSNEDLGYPT